MIFLINLCLFYSLHARGEGGAQNVLFDIKCNMYMQPESRKQQLQVDPSPMPARICFLSSQAALEFLFKQCLR